MRVLHLKAQSVRWPTCCWRDGVRHLKVERGDWLWSRSGPVRVVEPLHGSEVRVRPWVCEGDDWRPVLGTVVYALADLDPCGAAQVGDDLILLGSWEARP